jgi:glycosyltransferase involved in cell wall biosynthesis
MSHPVSVVVLARNEETLIGECLSSVAGWADELVVVDMGSTDATASIAREMGAVVLSHPVIGNFDLARTPGIMAARNDWILVLDADEAPTVDLLETLAGIVADDGADLLKLPRANLCLSGFARHAERFPETTLRMFKRSKVDVEGYTGRIHTFYHPVEGARIHRVPGSYPRHCLLHFTNPSLGAVWAKTDLYTSEEAMSRGAGIPKSVRPWHLWGPVRVFFRRLVWSGAWRDGWRGFWLSWLSASYEMLVLAKQWEMSLHDGRIPDAAMARSRMRRLVREAADGESSVRGEPSR